ncbi:hypothetical protein HJ160_24410 [Vibrio parahaemolyticus]|nr:hypothetical protein [Vibrio parahaemolyticus]
MKRGTVKRITFEIEYPDGTTKTSVLDEEVGLNDVASIVLGDEYVPEEELTIWNASENWRENPTMLILKKHVGPAIPWCYTSDCVPVPRK